MWKDYSVSFIRRNRSSSISIMAAAFISTLFLSLICCLFFNFWIYEIEKITLEEGGWQGRIVGEIDEEDVTIIQNFANVERAEINEELQETAVDIYFRNARTIFQDMPLITEKLGLEENASSYHRTLLSRYMIHDPQDKEPPLLMAFYLVILLLISSSLILIIHNSFAVSMNARIHQFGIFSSIGATPRQIRICLMQEAAVLCILPILLGSLIGIAFSFGIIQAMNQLAVNVAGRHEAVFRYHPFVFAVTIVTSVLTVLISAWLPARKLSKLTPLQAIRNTNELQLKNKKQSYMLSWIFGIEGELAGNAVKAQKKALRTSTLSLTFSFLAFTLMLCFFTLSGISTNYTYFERYQDVWDVMATLKDTEMDNFELIEEVGALQDVQSTVVYQKAEAISILPKASISKELNELGGLEIVAGDSVTVKENDCFIPTPIIILDDKGFIEYCSQIGITPGLDGAVVLNRIWDRVNSNFRYKQYIPYMEEDQNQIILQDMDQNENETKVPVLAYTQIPPILREEYENYALVQIISSSLWETLSSQINHVEPNTYIRIIGREREHISMLNQIEDDLTKLITPKYELEVENRIQEKITNEYLIGGYQVIIGAFCGLLAIIGIANVFSNALGFLYQRKREFAQYISMGMTPESMKKMFLAEVFVIAGRPVFITIPVTVIVVGFMIKASYLDAMEFLKKAPIVPIGIFFLIVFAFVALAYYIGGKRVLNYRLSDVGID